MLTKNLSLNTSQYSFVHLPVDAHTLCVAGPGSGKTHTLIQRIVRISEVIHPSRIRAVTFSRAATTEMQERLIAEDAKLQDVSISTIHSLCRQLIKSTQGATLESRDFQCYVEGASTFKKENPDKAILSALTQYLEGIRTEDREAYLEIATAVSSRQKRQKKPIFVDNVEEVADAFLSLSLYGSPVDQIKNYIDYKRIKTHCETYLQDAKLPAFSIKYTKYVLRWKFEKTSLLEMLSSVYTRYCDILKAWKLLDYTDQLIQAHLGLMQCSEQTRRQLQEKWDVLAVDEFQDVDAIQFAVFRLLCERQMRLNAVGDPDQAIYGFRGGDAQFISDYREYFPQASITQLDTNYRSTAKIIDVSYAAVASLVQPYRAKGASVQEDLGRVAFAEIDSAANVDESETVGVLAWTNKTLKELSDQLLSAGVVCARNTRWGAYLNIPKPIYDKVSLTLQALAMLTGDTPFDRDIFLTAAKEMKGIGATTVARAQGATLQELRKSPKIAGYVRELSAYRNLPTAALITAIFASGQFGSVDVNVLSALQTLDFSKTYQQQLTETQIQLYTIHRVKGLEFDTVFVETGDFAKTFAEENTEESKRLLFVALSRAKRNLFILGSQEQGNTITAPVVEKISGENRGGNTSVPARGVLQKSAVDIPEGMPLTNRLDKMTVEQARWAVRNGDRWLAYLREHGGEIFPAVNNINAKSEPAPTAAETYHRPQVPLHDGRTHHDKNHSHRN